jgi:hypothetical protein
MMEEKWDARVAHICVEVISKQGYQTNESLVADNTDNIPRSGVTNVNASCSGPNAEGMGDTSTSPP